MARIAGTSLQPCVCGRLMPSQPQPPLLTRCRCWMLAAGHRRGMKRNRILVGLALLASSVGAVMWLWWIVRATPPESGATVATQRAEHATSAPVAMAPKVVGEAGGPVREACERGIEVRLLAADGAPLIGYAIAVHRCEPPAAAARAKGDSDDDVQTATTGVDGQVLVAVAEPGQYSVSLEGGGDLRGVVTVADGVAPIELRFGARQVVVTLKFLRRGEPQPFRAFELAPDAASLGMPWSGVDGTRRIVVPPGAYEVRIRNKLLAAEYVDCSAHPLLVPDGVARMDVAFDVGEVLVEVLVMAPERAHAEVAIDVVGVAQLRNESGAATMRGNVGEPLHLWLPAGTWQLQPRSPMLAALPPQEVSIAVGDPPVRLLVEGQPGACVSLDLRDARGESVSVAAELMPPLRARGSSHPCVKIGEEHDLHRVIAYEGVAIADAEVDFVDRVLDDEHIFLPFVPRGPLRIAVVGNGRDKLAVQVERRPFVDLRACLASGREDGSATIQLLLDDRPVRGRRERFAQRWSGWLPPGDYRVVVKRGKAVRETALNVATRDITLRLRP
jgi:hypothetical protein